MSLSDSEVSFVSFSVLGGVGAGLSEFRLSVSNS